MQDNKGKYIESTLMICTRLHDTSSRPSSQYFEQAIIRRHGVGWHFGFGVEVHLLNPRGYYQIFGETFSQTPYVVEGVWTWLGDPGTILGSRGVPYPREVDEAYSGDDGQRCS
jgi:hypothetical protein